MPTAARNKSTFALELTGVTDLRGFLTDLNPGSQDRIIMGAMKKGGDHIANLAKQNISSVKAIDTGALRKSMGTIVKRMSKTGKIIAFIGARSRYYVSGKRLKPGQKYRKNQLRNPAKYSHLVEYGFRMGHGGGALEKFYGVKTPGVFNFVNKNKSFRKGTLTQTGFIPGRPFLRPAYFQAQNAAGSEAMKGFERALRVEFNRAKRRFDKKKLILA